MKYILVIVGIIMLLSCYSRRDMYYAQEQQRIADSLAQVKKQMKADDDNDGVINYYDQCPDTPKEARIDALGCPMDVDNDGVKDYEDECLTVPGTVANKGCPEKD